MKIIVHRYQKCPCTYVRTYISRGQLQCIYTNMTLCNLIIITSWVRSTRGPKLQVISIGNILPILITCSFGYFTQIQHTTSLSQANSIHTQSQIGISTQNGISNSGAYFTCNTCNWYTRFVYIKVQVYYYNCYCVSTHGHYIGLCSMQ